MEILIVTFMLAVIVLSLISVFSYGFSLLAKSKQVTLATEVAQFEVERFRNMAFDTIANGSTTTAFTREDFPALFRYGDDGAPYLPNGQETITVEQGDDENIKRLSITITWEFRGREIRQDVVTYITRDGINRK